MLAVEAGLVVWDDLREFVDRDSDDSTSHELEDLLLRDGRAINPIVYWAHRDQRVVIDGHRRLALCTKHNLEFDIVEKSFRDLDEVKFWMACQQCSRRNLNRLQRARLMQLMEEYLHKEKMAGRFKGSVNGAVAKANGVSRRAVSGMKADIRNVNKLPEPIAERMLGGDLKATSEDIREMVVLPLEEQLRVVRELDKGEFTDLTEALTGKKRHAKVLELGGGKEAAAPASKARTNGHAAKLVNGSAKALVDNAIKALGVLHKAIDELAEHLPNAQRKSSAESHITNLRNTIKQWKTTAGGA